MKTITGKLMIYFLLLSYLPIRALAQDGNGKGSNDFSKTDFGHVTFGGPKIWKVDRIYSTLDGFLGPNDTHPSFVSFPRLVFGDDANYRVIESKIEIWIPLKNLNTLLKKPGNVTGVFPIQLRLKGGNIEIDAVKTDGETWPIILTAPAAKKIEFLLEDRSKQPTESSASQKSYINSLASLLLSPPPPQPAPTPKGKEREIRSKQNRVP